MKVKDLYWYEGPYNTPEDHLCFTWVNGYRITVLNRLTGYGDGVRDTETGLKDYRRPKDNDFWLASGMFDIRRFPELTVEEAIEKIKENANTVIPAPEGE